MKLPLELTGDEKLFLIPGGSTAGSRVRDVEQPDLGVAVSVVPLAGCETLGKSLALPLPPVPPSEIRSTRTCVCQML